MDQHSSLVDTAKLPFWKFFCAFFKCGEGKPNHCKGSTFSGFLSSQVLSFLSSSPSLLPVSLFRRLRRFPVPLLLLSALLTSCRSHLFSSLAKVHRQLTSNQHLSPYSSYPKQTYLVTRTDASHSLRYCALVTENLPIPCLARTRLNLP